MTDPTLLRNLALDMHAHADQVVADCGQRPPCWLHAIKVDVYRSLGADFHQRAIRAEQEVSR